MTLSYRARRNLRSFGSAALFLVLLLILVWIVWLFWLDRYVVYTRDGAKLDFSQSIEHLSGQPVKPPESDFSVDIYYNEGDGALNITTELTQLSGYYITKDMLADDIDTLQLQLSKLPAQTPVLIDVKDITGRFFYTTSLGPTYKGIDTDKMDSFIEFLSNSGLYVIARVPALRDYYYGLNSPSDGLPTSGGYLWLESETRCYWLNPASEGTLTHLMQTAAQLKSLGFNEVVFSDFRFPDTDKIIFKGDKQEALANAAKSLVDASASEHFAVSFQVEQPTLTLPDGRTRMYLEGKNAAEAKALAQMSGLENPSVNLVFLTDLNDTRFDEFGALRPITSAVIE